MKFQKEMTVLFRSKRICEIFRDNCIIPYQVSTFISHLEQQKVEYDAKTDNVTINQKKSNTMVHIII